MLACRYEVVKETLDEVILRDVGREYVSITNDIESVVYGLTVGVGLSAPLGTRNLLYYDRSGDLVEVWHDGAGSFLGFAT
jgi:hypothetical protein